ncbi:MAG: sigma-54 dependent transcriptional regulator [Candidatus Rifleibacteriota bacterium]
MNILIVDDNASLARGLKAYIEEENHVCKMATTVKEGIKLIEENIFDLIITDLKLPDGQGLEIVARAREADGTAAPEVILMTAFGSVETAVEAMRLGAIDYLTKPVSMEEFSFRIKKIENVRKLEKRNKTLLRQQQDLLDSAGLSGELQQIAGNSTAINEVKSLIRKVAPYPSTVLITGETGVGKELVARSVHKLSDRRDGPFIRVNCASIPDTLFESELFGHEKGAFTDAKIRRQGCFEAAEGGTVFLDEVGEIPLNLQAKLLRFLQEKEVVRLGSNMPIKVDVRIVAATNRNLEQMVSDGLFREDLLYRLSVFKIHVPPLRERVEDIGPIAENLLSRLCIELKRPGLKLSEACKAKLEELAWPGNIRELKNSLERAAVMAESEILEPVHFNLASGKNGGMNKFDKDQLPNENLGLIEALENLERSMIKAALERNQNVKSRAADELKIPRTQLLYRMKRLGLSTD